MKKIIYVLFIFRKDGSVYSQEEVDVIKSLTIK